MYIICFSFVCLLFLSVISAAVFNCYPTPVRKDVSLIKLVD